MTSICPLSVSITGMRTGGAGGFSSGSLRRGSICHWTQLYHFLLCLCKRGYDRRKRQTMCEAKRPNQQQDADPRGTTKLRTSGLGSSGIMVHFDVMAFFATLLARLDTLLPTGAKAKTAQGSKHKQVKIFMVSAVVCVTFCCRWW